MTYKKLEQNKNKYKYEVEVDFADFEKERSKAIVELSKTVKVPALRPGKAPKDTLEKEVGYKAYLEAVNKILPKAALEVIEKEQLNPISSFKYDLKDLDKDKNISFTFEFITQPEIKLEDYKKIKVDYSENKIEEGEADLVIKNIIKTSLPREKWEKNIIKKEESVSKNHEAEVTKNDKAEEEHEHHDHEGHNHPHDHKHDDEDITITDDLIAKIGYEDEKTYAGLKKKVEETLQRIKKEDAENQFASKVIAEALKVSDFEIPEDFVEHESAHKEEHFKERLRDLKLDETMYLKTQNTSIEDLRKGWRDEAERNIRTDLLLINLGVAENLTPTDAEVEQTIEKLEDPALKQRYKSEDNKNYLKTSLTRDKALNKLVETVKANK